MKRILFIEATDSKGGIETFILNTCKYLDRDRYQITVLANCPECSIENELSEIGITVHHIHSAEDGFREYYADLKKEINSSKYDIVHINKNSLANPVALWLCKKRKIEKIFLHSHNTHPTYGKMSSLLHNVFKRILISKNIRRIACSGQAAKWMFSDDDACLLLKNGIETEKYAFDPLVRERVRTNLGLTEKQPAICNVGRLCEQKNPLFLIEIMSKLLLKLPNAKLYLIGTGELENAVRKKIADLKIENHIVLLGRRTDVNELLQGMDLFLMPSLHEGLPIAAIEAQTSGLPLLISDKVDRDVRLLETTEFESLDASADSWAEHCIKMIKYPRKHDADLKIKKAGYDIKESTAKLVKLYTE